MVEGDIIAVHNSTLPLIGMWKLRCIEQLLRGHDGISCRDSQKDRTDVTGLNTIQGELNMTIHICMSLSVFALYH